MLDIIDVDFDWLKRFFKYNPLYLLCSFIYLTLGALSLGGGAFGWFFSTVLYAVSLALVFSPVGERLLRIIENIRPLYTKREKDYLLPIFEEVYYKAKETYPKLRLELCVIDQMHVQACALGLHTIAVTKGAMETFSEDELKAVIGHEIGHVVNMDTTASLFFYVGHGYYSIYILLSRFFVNLFMKIIYSTQNGILKAAASLARYLYEFSLFGFTLIINIFIALNSRNNEHRADYYTYSLGFGQEMIEALYLLEKINLSSNHSIITKMIARHPIIPLRIAHLEYLYENN